MAEKEYIERAPFIEDLTAIKKEYDAISIDGMISALEEEIAADVVEVRYGSWIKRGNEKRCSRCDFIYYSNNDEWNYCPNCGAKMYGGKHETD